MLPPVPLAAEGEALPPWPERPGDRVAEGGGRPLPLVRLGASSRLPGAGGEERGDVRVEGMAGHVELVLVEARDLEARGELAVEDGLQRVPEAERLLVLANGGELVCAELLQVGIGDSVADLEVPMAREGLVEDGEKGPLAPRR